MNKKHPNGYWIQQLTDENVEELLRKLNTSSTKKFKRILKQERTDTSISAQCCATRTDQYLTYAENNYVIGDYTISRQYEYRKFYEYMIEKFGEDYAKDLISYIDEYIAQNPGDSLSTRLNSIKAKIPAIINKYSNSIDNNL